MKELKLSEEQKKIYEGLICPYCKKETELLNADQLYKTKGLGMVRICRDCQAWVGIHTSGENKGKAKGRLANPSLRSLKIRAHAELDRLWVSKEDRSAMYRSLSEFMNLPEEFTHVGYFNESSIMKVFAFCFEHRDKTGTHLKYCKAGENCPDKKSMKVGSRACEGCPSYLHSDKEGNTWCNDEMSYGRLKVGGF